MRNSRLAMRKSRKLHKFFRLPNMSNLPPDEQSLILAFLNYGPKGFGNSLGWIHNATQYITTKDVN